MKILLINSRYFPAAGPEKYLFNIKAVLETHGHEVVPFSIRNTRNVPSVYSSYFAENIGGGDEMYFEEMDTSISTRMQLVARQFHSLHVQKKLEALIRETRPDIAYILHYQNRLSPSVITACKKQNLPCVLRISDFSLLCIGNHLLRDGRVCELCIDNGVYNGVRYRCVKGSAIGSVIKAAALKYHRLRKTFSQVDRVVVPSLFTMSKLHSVLNNTRMTHLPTMVPIFQEIAPPLGDYALFVGRVEEEKGLEYAIKAFERTEHQLKIVGFSHSGHEAKLREYVKDREISNVQFIGPKFGDELKEFYRNCRFVIAPGICYENLPNVVLEAMAHGKPVAASDIGSMREVVVPQETGFLFEVRNSDACLDVVRRLFGSDELCRELGSGGRKRVEQCYSSSKHYASLMAIFSEVLSVARPYGPLPDN